ncbi:MAG: hypothetical protein QNJ72_33720 [Pleurocapsa sp. MO_226.B13]|nr:hypothetical protein [Pleurocapsa sp. MO_226.B13]
MNSSNSANHNQLEAAVALSLGLGVEVIERNQLSVDEERDRLHLERKVERAFYEAGMALKELRDRRLYRSTHKTFESYCRERFGYGRDAAYLKIVAAEVYDNLNEIMPTNCRQIPLPTNEHQLRYIAKARLKPEMQLEVWRAAVELAKGKVPSGRIVKNVVRQIKAKPIPISYRQGEICRLIAKDNPELRGKGGCWCIVTEVYEFSCQVNTWDGEYIVRPEYLKSFNYSEIECKQMEDLGVRMSRLHKKCGLDTGALWILNGLAKLDKPYLVPLEEKLLALLEAVYLSHDVE